MQATSTTGAKQQNGHSTADFSPEQHIRQAFELFCNGDVGEIRAFDEYSTYSGYFDNPDDFIAAGLKQDAAQHTAYVTLNPVDPALLAKSNNRVKKMGGKRATTTPDKHIRRRRWILVDCDPIRPEGIPSADEEKEAAREKAREVKAELSSRGITAIVVADSANGYHLLIRVDLPNDEASTKLVENVLKALDLLFSDERVKIDTGVFNASRITKLYGTTPRKGDGTTDRPHRPSRLLSIPETLEPVDRALLEELANQAPDVEPDEEPRGRRIRPDDRFDIPGFLDKHGIPVLRHGSWNSGGMWANSEKWLVPCPWNGHTDNSCHIIQAPNGAISCKCKHDSCQGYRWQDFREFYEPGVYDRDDHARDSANSANSANGDKNSTEEPWAPPAAFHSFDLPEFPRSVFPAWASDYVEALAEATQTPRALSGMLTITIGGAVSSKLVEVEVWNGWKEPTNVFTATGLRSGSRKTTVFERMCAPLEEYEAGLTEETAEEIAEQKTKRRVYEGRLKRAEQQASKADGDELDKLTADAMQAAADLESIEVPAEPRLLVDDASPERLASLLAEQGGRIALMSAEGGVFDMMAGRYSQGIPNLDVYLKGHAGDALRVDRVGRAPDFVRRPALTAGLAVQPDVLRGLASKPGFRGRGLLGRFQYAMPRDTLGSRRIRTAPVARDVEETYRHKIKYILGLSPKLPAGEREPHVLRFSSEAQDEMEQFMLWIEPRLAEEAEFGDMTDWAGKLAGTVARIAGILHMLDYAGKMEPWKLEISAHATRRAIQIGHYLIPHAKYALAFMGSDPTVEDAKYILRWMERKECEWFTKREAFEGTKGRFGKVSELEPGLELLVAHGYIREDPNQPQPRGPGRKPSPRYEVNPLIKPEPSSQNSHYSQNREEDEETEGVL